MGALLEFATVLQSEVCAACGIEFAMPQHFVTKRRESGKEFFCPNGHSLSFSKSEVQRLREQLERKEQQLAQERTARDEAERRLVGQRAATTRAQNAKKRMAERVAAGVCPCCNRTFQNLARHMAGQHPDFVADTCGQDVRHA